MRTLIVRERMYTHTHGRGREREREKYVGGGGEVKEAGGIETLDMVKFLFISKHLD